ncbi:P27 family phage terminase small subunit [Anaerorhabdus sp.]|uniref:P27 family phage terminase small subunit n=1 Tax=Anaerorhabdus sp. TaxID=1872524 RepID=UPI002B20DF50|nr:P27 family phage terminase small subunit [Anaerorhabdus sp.]MEA4876017.1 P27 family phage terminase small subunit [Anaerorhabdus sp.]
MGTSVKNLIEQDLISQLEERGVLLKYHEDLVKDYLSYYDIKRKLIADIKKRGVSVFYQNGENQKGYKRNESVSELNKITATMLKILSELGLKPPQKASDGDGGNADLL